MVFDVLIEREVQGWVRIEADSEEEVQAKMLRLPASEIPNQRERRWAPLVLNNSPRTRHGRVYVNRAVGTCGANPQMLLYLDCGHKAYIDVDLWYPENPYYECGACARRGGA